MKVNIINYCQKPYKLNPEELIQHILEKIPDKFLIALAEVRIFDVRKDSDSPHVKYIQPTQHSKEAILEIYMDDPTFHLFSFFSILCFNMSFLDGVNEHIEKYVKRHSNNKKIMLKNPLRYNYEWMFFGLWYPLFFVLFIIPHYLFSKSRIFRKVALYLRDLFVRKVKKMMAEHEKN